MFERIIAGIVVLGACLPSVARTQTPRPMPMPMHARPQPPTTRAGAFEFSIGGGFTTIDRRLNGNLLVPMTISDPDPSRFAFGGAVRLGYNLTSAFGLSVGTMLSKGSGATINSPFVDLTWTPAMNSGFSPFFMVGAGVSRFSAPGIHETSSFGGHLGMGVRVMMGERVALRLEGRMQAERFEELRPSSNPAYNSAGTLGLSFFTGGRAIRDADQDGVADSKDRCADTARGATVDANGCPRDDDSDGILNGLDRCANTPSGAPVDATGCVQDSDGDGVMDNADRCPGTPSGMTVTPTGCIPVVDADRDGVADAMDRCPNTPDAARPVDATGCATDTDRDGVADHADRCPNSPASTPVTETGCPRDTDADGVADGTDRCPNTVRGAAVDATGCNLVADTDNDGVPDPRDRCPNSPSNRAVDSLGCTLIALPTNPTDQMVLRVQFVTSRSTLVPASTIVLDSVATAILASPGSRWEVQGYTDSRGSAAMNQRLSQARAQAVVDYLTSKGVSRATMTATGFGPERPIASNTTSEGQAANRRVQLRRLAAENPNPLP